MLINGKEQKEIEENLVDLLTAKVPIWCRTKEDFCGAVDNLGIWETSEFEAIKEEGRIWGIKFTSHAGDPLIHSDHITWRSFKIERKHD